MSVAYGSRNRNGRDQNAARRPATTSTGAVHRHRWRLRDMTVIETPPRDRSPVLTFVEPWDDGLIEEAVARELDRGGQVFFVHNRIETIEAVADHVRRLAPRAMVAVAHGQMRERDLDEVMRRFVSGEVTVLGGRHDGSHRRIAARPRRAIADELGAE